MKSRTVLQIVGLLAWLPGLCVGQVEITPFYGYQFGGTFEDEATGQDYDLSGSAAAGAMINVKMAIILSPILFLYVMVMIVVHMVSVYGVGRLLRLDIRILTIASAAAKTGPPSVIALANVHGWKTHSCVDEGHDPSTAGEVRQPQNGACRNAQRSTDGYRSA